MSFSGIFSEIVGLVMTRNSAIILGSVSLPLILLRFLFKFLLKVRWQYIVSKYPRDVVILHQFPRGYRIPSVSPFVLKLETWLRMNNIKYENKHGYTFGPKGKLPFITYNGEDVADSQFIIEYLSKKLNKGLNGGFSPKDLGAARAFNKMAEESIFWVSGLSRFVYEPNPRYFGMHPLALKYLARTYRSRTKVQGYGLHTKDEVFTIGKTDLKSLNDFLEGKKFLIGDKPCNEDASVFGIVAQFVYTENATMNKFILNECPNIVNYIENIKTTYWPDWNQCINRKKND